MLILFLKIAIRNNLRRKVYTIINTLGLSLGVAVFLLICFYIFDELHYDKCHTNASKIFRIVSTYKKEGVGEKTASCPFPLAQTFQKENPELVKNVVRFFNFQIPHSLLQYGEKRFNEKRFYLVDSTVFDVFDFEFIKGDPKTALTSPFKIVINESTAKRYFDDNEPIGKILTFEEGFNFEVSGVVKDFPNQSHFKFDMLASMTSLKKIIGVIPDDWVWDPCWTYIQLYDTINQTTINERLNEFVKKHYKERKEYISLELQPLTDIHLASHFENEIGRNSYESNLYMLFSIGVFILLIAFINFMNLTIASSLNRAKEVGVKKVFGADRTYIIMQFLAESVILTVIAIMLGLLLVEQLLPVFNFFTEKTIEFDIFFRKEIFVPFLLIGFILSILSGLYPALSLSAFNPARVLSRSFTSPLRNPLPRKILVVVQYSISIILLIITIVNIKQFVYLRTTDLGFNKEQVIILPVCNTPIIDAYDEFKEEVEKQSEIVSITIMSDIIGVNYNSREYEPQGFPENKKQRYPEMIVGPEFVKTFDIQILAGRDFSQLALNERTGCVLINEAMVKHLGCNSNEKAIGKFFSTFGQVNKVVGVINDFNVSSLHTPMGPFILTLPKDFRKQAWVTKYLAIRAVPDKLVDAIKITKKLWKKYAPTRPYEFTFLDKELNLLYKNEEILVKLTAVLTFIAVLIASLGILGLTSYLTQQRTKEIGIRKVLGSTVFGIIELLSYEFLKLILISNVFAWPFAYFLVSRWLDNFAYQIDLQLWMFSFAALIAIFFALTMVAYESYKAAISNPLNSLRYE